MSALTNQEWRDFQSIPDQGYSHRGWVDARIAKRVAERDEQIAALQAVIAHTLGHLDEQIETGLPLFPESIAVRLRRVGSVELDRVKREAAAEALEEAANDHGLPSDHWLRIRAARVRGEATR